MKTMRLNDDWKWSDHTEMHLATARGMMFSRHTDQEYFKNICIEYRDTIKRVSNPQGQNYQQIRMLNSRQPISNGYQEDGYGQQSTFRAPCIGLCFDDETHIDQMIEISIETARMTNHHPLAYLSTFMAALFTRLALKKVPPETWIAIFLKYKQKVVDHI